MSSDHPGIFMAGAARKDTTPPVGTFIYGYKPNYASTSVHDRLSVTALAISEGKKTALIVTAEIGDLQTPLCHDIINRLSETCGVPGEHIIVSCTHTHCAPNLSGTVGWGDLDTEYYNGIFLPAVLAAAKEALSSLSPAEIAVGVTESRVGINRRQQNPDGSIGLGQNPHGCFDPNMTVVAIRNAENGEGILNMLHYGCHGTSAGLDTEITRDWSGVMIDRLEKETGTLTAFWNGAVGDVGPRLVNGGTVGDISHTEELGGLAAVDAMRAYRARGGYHPGKLEIFSDEVRLPYSTLPSIEEVERSLKKYPEPEKLNNVHLLEYEHFKAVKELLENPNADAPQIFSFPQTLISLGDVLFVPFPFEMFSEIVMRLREYSPYPYTLCLSCANGYYLYLPSEDQLCRGGYEVECFMYGSLFPLARNTDQHIISENLRILRENKKTK